MTPATNNLPVPRPERDPQTEPYWQAAAEGALLIPRCNSCGRAFWYPRSFCPHCGLEDISWEISTGRGTVYSYTVVHKAIGQWSEAIPYVVAYVELAEGPRVLANVVDCNEIAVGMPVLGIFDTVESKGDGEDRIAVLRFRPTD